MFEKSKINKMLTEAKEEAKKGNYKNIKTVFDYFEKNPKHYNDYVDKIAEIINIYIRSGLNKLRNVYEEYYLFCKNVGDLVQGEHVLQAGIKAGDIPCMQILATNLEIAGERQKAIEWYNKATNPANLYKYYKNKCEDNPTVDLSNMFEYAKLLESDTKITVESWKGTIEKSIQDLEKALCCFLKVYKQTENTEMKKRAAYQIAKINLINGKETEALKYVNNDTIELIKNELETDKLQQTKCELDTAIQSQEEQPKQKGGTNP